MSRITFLDNALRGKNNWWRYLLTIFLTYGGGQAWAAMIPILISIIFYFILGGAAASQAEGIHSNPFSQLIIAGSVEIVLFSIFYLSIRFIHKRKFISLVNTDFKFNWQKLLKGAGIWLIIITIVNILTLLLFGNFKVTFNPYNFIFLLVLSLIIFPIQASFEELFFRGYLMQGIGLLTKKPVIPLLATSIVFAAPHYLNNTSSAVGFSWALDAFIFGITMGIVVLGENRLETAMGAHIINNIFDTVVVYDTSEGLFGNLPAIVTTTTQGTHNLIITTLTFSLWYSLPFLAILFWNKKDRIYNIFMTR